MTKNCSQIIYPGATIHIWTEDGRTMMQIINNHNPKEIDPFNVIETTLLLSDKSIPELGCNIYFHLYK